jgi:hypothetical protein
VVSWQVVEARRLYVGGGTVPETDAPHYQYVWSRRYLDAPALRDENQDSTVDDLCDDVRLVFSTDANMNVTCSYYAIPGYALVLAVTLPPELGYAIAADGSVQIAPREQLIGGFSAAAAETVARLHRKGMIDGVDWSLNFASAADTQKKILGRLAEKVRQPPHGVRVDVDAERLSKYLDGEAHVLFQDASLHEFLTWLLRGEGGYVVRRDGSVLVTSLARVAELAAGGEALSPQGLTGRWEAPDGAEWPVRLLDGGR